MWRKGKLKRFYMTNLREMVRLLLWPSINKVELMRQDIFVLRQEVEKALYESVIYRSSEVEQLYREVFRQIVPKSVVGFGKKRFGGDADGGYVMVDHFDGVAAAYSLGVQEEVSWDLELARRGIPIFQYDDSIERPPVAHELFTFTKNRITDAGNIDLGHESIEGIVEKHRHQGKKLILKMDIEGSEWEALDAISGETLKLFDQIVVEFHHLTRIPEYQFRKRALRVFNKLNLHHTPIHIHANNCGRVVRLVNFYFAEILEISYVKTENYSLVENREVFPGPEDRPNNPELTDIYLGSFTFD